MTKRRSQAEIVKRRSHSSIDSLPVKLQATIRQMIVNREWPEDFGEHYSGLPRYVDVIQYCRKKGYTISKSAMGRYSLSIQTTSIEEIKNNVKPYVLARLVNACEDFAKLQNELLTAQQHPERMPHVAPQRAELELLAEQELSHIEQVIADLRKLK